MNGWLQCDLWQGTRAQGRALCYYLFVSTCQYGLKTVGQKWQKTSWPPWKRSSLTTQPAHILDLTLWFSSFVGIRRLLNCRVKFSGPEGIFCGVWKVWPGLKVFRLCGNTAVLLSGIILFYWMWRLLLESVQLEMCLYILEGIGHAWIFLPHSVFDFKQIYFPTYCISTSHSTNFISMFHL